MPAALCTPHSRPTLRILKLMISFAMLAFSTACSVFGVETVEEAPFQLVQREKQFEIRDYAPLVVAETRVNATFKEAGNKAFRKLFAYISGENEVSEKITMTSPVIADAQDSGAGQNIAMTAPVTSQKEGNEWRYRFVLPKNYSLENAPRPLNPDVTLAQIPAKRVATLRYSGRTTAAKQIKQAELLTTWMVSQGLVEQSQPRWAGYNAPWTLPWFRRNEVLIDVSNQ